MSGQSKKLRKKVLRLLTSDKSKAQKLERLLDKHNPVLLAVLRDVTALANPTIRAHLYSSIATALLGKKKDAKETQKLAALLQSSLNQNHLIDLKRPFKKSPCSGCAANRNGICRCAQKAVKKTVQK